MKTKLIKVFTIICCFSLLVSTNVEGQEVDTSINKTQQDMHDMFMQKHKSKTTAGTITLCSGLVIAGVGFAIYDEGSEGIFGIPSENNVTSAALVLIGGASTLVSVPLFISAGSSKRKAKLALKRESSVVGFENNTQHVSLSFTIPF